MIDKDKTVYIVIGVLLLLIIIGYGIWIWYTYTKQTGFFKPYVPKPQNPDLYQAQTELPKLTPDQEAKKQRMIKQAKLNLVKQNLKFDNPYRKL